MLSNIINILLSFVTQSLLIKFLGTEYTGLNGLFLNIISMLGISELGIGQAIIYNLYKPIKDNNREKIKSLLCFYKRSYHIIAIIIIILGICILPFINTIIGENNIKENVHLIFIFFLIDSISSYLLSYKRSILYATQKNYIVDAVHIICLIGMNIIQMLVLIVSKNYYLYVFLRVVFRVIENIIITNIANKRYPYVKEKNVNKLEKTIKKDIIQKVKGSIFHSSGAFIVLNSDNIIISTFLNLDILGRYLNYNMIIKSVSNLFSQIFTAMTASIGNLLAYGDSEKAYDIYRKVTFLNFWIFSYSTISIFCIIEPFITIWIGKEFILPIDVLIVLVLNFYIQRYETIDYSI